MSTTKIKQMLLKLPGLNLPERSEKVAWAQIVEFTGITPSGMAELIELGWLEPSRTSADEYLFPCRDVLRIQKLLRLCNDLEISATGGTIIVDLMERIEELEREVEELQRHS
ncbi:chaperone modulator CbpM [Pseudodesulfovibrio senegalensis]|uniref:MerR family transcriptional regulator n=1 Tax=Pseudodesulfovibrio senegalensis TaxID=1721087 RepID=A0A6N6N6B8_9BACT|nr:chaperone modulator CbpM [Pseudodesulfovibrio senegalensis]KAB1443288.1 MerR family transcriptional regulator [Pseudodesulfovibrio senegalensis]